MSNKNIKTQSTEDNENIEEIRSKLEEIVTNSSKGVMELASPLMVDGRELKQLHFDFKSVSGWEYVDTVDKYAGKKSDAYRLNTAQALGLFALAASKATEGVDEGDVMRLSIEDSLKAVQLATLFFNSASRLGDMRITNA